MGRPYKYNDGATTSIRLERAVLNLIKRAGIPMSDILTMWAAYYANDQLKKGSIDPLDPLYLAYLEVQPDPFKNLVTHETETNDVLRLAHFPPYTPSTPVGPPPLEQPPLPIEEEEPAGPTDLERLSIELPLTDDERLRYHRAVQTYMGNHPGGSRSKAMVKGCQEILEKEFTGHDFEEYYDLPGTFYDLICGLDEEEVPGEEYDMDDIDVGYSEA